MTATARSHVPSEEMLRISAMLLCTPALRRGIFEISDALTAIQAQGAVASTTPRSRLLYGGYGYILESGRVLLDVDAASLNQKDVGVFTSACPSERNALFRDVNTTAAANAGSLNQEISQFLTLTPPPLPARETAVHLGGRTVQVAGHSNSAVHWQQDKAVGG